LANLTSQAPLQDLHDAYLADTRRNNLRWLGICFVFLLLVFLFSWIAEVSPLKFWKNIGNFNSYIDRILHLDNGDWVVSHPAEWFWGFKKWFLLMLETILMAYVGTFFGCLGALLLCFLASQNITKSKTVVFICRRFLEFSRTVPELVFALIFVFAFSLGPLPGVLAITIHSTGALGKLFAEVVENIDMKPVVGIVSCGGNWWQKIRFGVIPQVLPNFASYTLLRFEINVRGAAVMGFVGAGGIGETLMTSIRRFYYSDVSALLVMIVVTVMLIDVATEKLRHTMMDWESSI